MNNIINKLFGQDKTYYVDLVIDKAQMGDAVEKMYDIIDLEDNKIHGFKNIELNLAKERVRVSFATKRSRDIFVKGVDKYVDYRAKAVNC